jgi:hypothetical protein
MVPRPAFKVEHILYFAIVLLGTALRFVHLGTLPLTELEAQAAMQAHSLAAGTLSALGAQPAYVLLTSLLFLLLPSSEFLTRLLPALFGCALVALPYFWRDLLGRKAALLLSLALALDPGLVAVSRLASGQMLALAALFIAITTWRLRWPALTGGFVAFALLAAPGIYFGVLGIALLWALFFSNTARINRDGLRPALIAAAATLIVGGTLFLRVPEGLGAIGSVFATFLSGWTQTSGVPVLLLLFSLIGYSLPALIFGVIGAIRAWTGRYPLGQALSVLAFITLALALIYPGRQVADLLWGLIPLWALAAMEASRYLQVPVDEPRAAFGEAGLMILLLTFFVFTLAKVSLNEGLPDLVGPYLILAGGVLLLGALATVLIAFGWSRLAATSGLAWAVSLFSVLFLFSASVRFQHSDYSTPNDLWASGPAAGETGLLAKSLRDLSYWTTGQPAELSVDLRVQSAALSWTLRDLPQGISSASVVAPALIITLASDAQPTEADTYRGQSFALQFSRSWATIPPNFFGWLLYRKVPTVPEQAILWASVAIFPDGATELQNPTDSSSN